MLAREVFPGAEFTTVLSNVVTVLHVFHVMDQIHAIMVMLL